MFSGRLVLCVGLQLAAAASAAPAPKPHILFAMADDLGWYNVGWRNPAVKTPHADKLVAEGIDLQRHYAFPFCSPSRSSLMSGRLPYHVNQVNRPNPVPGSGVPRNMTLISQKLQSAGYKTHQVRHASLSFRLALTSLFSPRLALLDWKVAPRHGFLGAHSSWSWL
jgi:arylsulfatase I/J